MIDKNKALDVFNFRHACKKFDPSKVISEDDFAFILEAGRLSPSSFGFEPWRFVIIQNKALREKLMESVWGSQGHLPTASHYVAILCRKSDMRHGSAYIEHIMRDVQNLPEEIIELKSGFFKKFQEEDMNLLESERSLFDWASKQAYIALGNMMTAAAMIEVDSCAVEGYDVQATENILSEANILDKDVFGLAVMAAFGYRQDPQPPKTRQAMDDVTVWVK